MGRYSQARRRGKCPPGSESVVSLPQVPLTVVGDSAIDWSDYDGLDPDHWRITEDGSEIASVGGAERSFLLSPAHNAAYIVQGFDSDDAAVTMPSNSVDPLA